MQGHVNRQEKEEKEAIYKDRWPDYIRELQQRWVYLFESQNAVTD